MSRRERRTSLYDSLSYLSSPSTPWGHTIIGWTGEIKPTLPPEFPADQTYPENITLPASLRKEYRDNVEAALKASVAPVWLATDPITDAIIYVANTDEKKLALRDQRRWRAYTDTELSPVLHYNPPQKAPGSVSRKPWRDYVKANSAFASKILEVYRPGDIIIIHDYHLMLVPELIRYRLPGAFIGFYLHAPFPSSEIFRCLPRRKDLLHGVLGSNMVGFQSYSYSRHFSSSCTRLLGYPSTYAGVDAPGGHVAVDVFPAGIDAASLLKSATEPEVKTEMIRLGDLHSGKHIIIGRDRLEYRSGLVQKLEAFEMFLTQYSQWRRKVILVQITALNNDAGPQAAEEDKAYASRVAALVEKINNRFGSDDHQPVHHHTKYLNKTQYLALLRVANLCLITSIRDGMNTTALEFAICQKFKCAPLAISEFSGTASALAAATPMNPWDVSSVCNAIHDGLTKRMDERMSRADSLEEYAMRNSVQAWVDRYVKRLVNNLSSFDQSMVTPLLDKTKLVEQYKRAKHRLFLFDYDGTLTPIVKDPQYATPSDMMLRTIKLLASNPRNAVWIISGRDQYFLDEWMGHISELGFCAEHGSFLRYPGQDEWLNLAGTADMSWQPKVDEVFRYYTERTQGSFIERKKIALTWHYRQADPEYGAFQAKACRAELEASVMSRWEVEVMSGKANVEVRPKFLNKGEIVSQLVRYYTEKGAPPELVLCLGDDVTDEGECYFFPLHGFFFPISFGLVF